MGLSIGSPCASRPLQERWRCGKRKLKLAATNPGAFFWALLQSTQPRVLVAINILTRQHDGDRLRQLGGERFHERRRDRARRLDQQALSIEQFPQRSADII